MTTLRTGYLPFDQFAVFGDAVPLLLARAVKYNYGEATVEQVLEQLRRREAFALAAVEGDRLTALATVRPVYYPSVKALSIEYAAGRRATALLFDAVKEVAKAFACDRIEFACRSSVARLAERFGFDTGRRLAILELI